MTETMQMPYVVDGLQADQPTPMDVPLTLIHEGETQLRVSTNHEAIRDYAAVLESDGELPPPDLYYDGETFWIGDGHHRIEAHRHHTGRSLASGEIRANVYRGGKREALLHAAGANAAHGLRRSNADKRNAVTVLLNDDEWAQWSDERIAQHCGVGRNFVTKMRAHLAPKVQDATPEFRLFRRNGKTHKMNVANIGSSKPKDRPLTEREAQFLASVPSPCIYVLSLDDRCKIGWSGYPQRRVQELLGQNPGAEIVALATGTMKDERRIHQDFECEQDSGEWFLCTAEEAINAITEHGLNAALFAPPDPKPSGRAVYVEERPSESESDDYGDDEESLQAAADEQLEQLYGLPAGWRLIPFNAEQVAAISTAGNVPVATASMTDPSGLAELINNSRYSAEFFALYGVRKNLIYTITRGDYKRGLEYLAAADPEALYRVRENSPRRNCEHIRLRMLDEAIDSIRTERRLADEEAALAERAMTAELGKDGTGLDNGFVARMRSARQAFEAAREAIPEITSIGHYDNAADTDRHLAHVIKLIDRELEPLTWYEQNTATEFGGPHD